VDFIKIRRFVKDAELFHVETTVSAVSALNGDM